MLNVNNINFCYCCLLFALLRRCISCSYSVCFFDNAQSVLIIFCISGFLHNLIGHCYWICFCKQLEKSYIKLYTKCALQLFGRPLAPTLWLYETMILFWWLFFSFIKSRLFQCSLSVLEEETKVVFLFLNCINNQHVYSIVCTVVAHHVPRK